MSKFIDKLKHVSQVEPQSMGFRAVRKISARPGMLLVASVAQSAVGSLADYVAGADAVILPVTGTGSTKTPPVASQAASGIPWGVWWQDEARGSKSKAVPAGCDFVVFPEASTPVDILQGDDVGKILQVEASLGDSLLRTIDGLPVDAVLIAAEPAVKGSLVWHHLMLFRRFAGLLTKPLLVFIPPGVTSNELQALWDAGVDCIIVGVEAGQPAGGLQELRQTLDKLVLTPSRRREKTEALLPYISRGTDVVTDEEEEEE